MYNWFSDLIYKGNLELVSAFLAVYLDIIKQRVRRISFRQRTT